jgi:hypothetical protein
MEINIGLGDVIRISPMIAIFIASSADYNKSTFWKQRTK